MKKATRRACNLTARHSSSSIISSFRGTNPGCGRGRRKREGGAQKKTYQHSKPRRPRSGSSPTRPEGAVLVVCGIATALVRRRRPRTRLSPRVLSARLLRMARPRRCARVPADDLVIIIIITRRDGPTASPTKRMAPQDDTVAFLAGGDRNGGNHGIGAAGGYDGGGDRGSPPPPAYALERQRFYVLGVNSALAMVQCLNWFTFSSVPVELLQARRRARKLHVRPVCVGGASAHAARQCTSACRGSHTSARAAAACRGRR